MSKLIIVNHQVDNAIAIMHEVSAWGRAQGFPVWSEESLTKEALLNDEATEDTFYVGRIGHNDVCGFILQWKDSIFWPEAPVNEAAYLHKFCVRREYAHQDMTKKVIEAIKQECRSRGVEYIRLDTGWNKEKVKQIYLDAGFHIVKKIILDQNKEMALYEMPVEGVTI